MPEEHTATGHHRSMSFLDLPVEIRIRIYEHYLADSILRFEDHERPAYSPLVQYQTDSELGLSRTSVTYKKKSKRLPQTKTVASNHRRDILYTCRSIYQEIHNLYYQHTQFIIGPHKLRAFLLSVPFKRHLRSLTLLHWEGEDQPLTLLRQQLTTLENLTTIIGVELVVIPFVDYGQGRRNSYGPNGVLGSKLRASAGCSGSERAKEQETMEEMFPSKLIRQRSRLGHGQALSLTYFMEMYWETCSGEQRREREYWCGIEVRKSLSFLSACDLFPPSPAFVFPFLQHPDMTVGGGRPSLC